MSHQINPVTGEKMYYHIDAILTVDLKHRPPVVVGFLREDLVSLPKLVSDYMSYSKAVRIEVENKRSGDTMVLLRSAA